MHHCLRPEGTVGTGWVARRSRVQQSERVVKQAGAQTIVGEVEPHLGVAPGIPSREGAGPGVERIERQRGTQQRRGLPVTPEPPQHDHLEIARLQVVGVARQSPVQVVEGGRPVAAPTVDLGQGVKPRRLPGLVPRGLVERRIGSGEQRRAGPGG